MGGRATINVTLIAGIVYPVKCHQDHLAGVAEYAADHQGHLPNEPRQLPHGRPDVHGGYSFNRVVVVGGFPDD